MMKKDNDNVYRELYKVAAEVRRNAYAPYSKFKVGAALLSENGKIYTGVNIENASYGATICAERSAISKAITDGERSFEAIAIAGGEEPAFPCGICRQVLAEFNPDITIIVGNGVELKSYSLEELIPHSFNLKGNQDRI